MTTQFPPTRFTSDVNHISISHHRQLNPYIMGNFPFYYGQYCPAAFWIEKTYKAGIHREVPFMAFWNFLSGSWDKPKQMVSTKKNISILLINNDPLSANIGIPFADGIQIEGRAHVLDKPEVVLQFCAKYGKYLDENQKTRIAEFLIAHSGSFDDQFELIRHEPQWQSAFSTSMQLSLSKRGFPAS